LEVTNLGVPHLLPFSQKGRRASRFVIHSSFGIRDSIRSDSRSPLRIPHARKTI